MPDSERFQGVAYYMTERYYQFMLPYFTYQRIFIHLFNYFHIPRFLKS